MREVLRPGEFSACISVLHFVDFARLRNGVVVQLVSTLACQARGRGFEPRRPRQVHVSNEGQIGSFG